MQTRGGITSHIHWKRRAKSIVVMRLCIGYKLESSNLTRKKKYSLTIQIRAEFQPLTSVVQELQYNDVIFLNLPTFHPGVLERVSQ